MNKSGTSSQVISHPSGGGALSGIGETFRPDLFTGTGNLSVPISCLPGRNGLQPELALSYSSGRGDGHFGLGWSIGLAPVSRDTSRGFPQYDDRDEYLLGSGERLVPFDRAEGRTIFRPRTDGAFSRIVHHDGEDNDYWEVRGRDGIISWFGTPETAGNDPAVLRNPQHPAQVFSWHITRTADPFGNHIAYEYERGAPDERSTEPWDELRLRRIRYCDFGPADALEYLLSVDFLYEDRPVPVFNRRAGFQVRTAKRCTAIEIATNAGTHRIWRRYSLGYGDQEPQRRGFSSGASLLTRIDVEGIDGDLTQALPPLEFDYSAFEPQNRTYFPLSAASGGLPPRSLSHPDFELADIVGDGLPDIVQIGDAARYWRNLGGGKLDVPRPLSQIPPNVRLGDTGTFLADTDGDGLIDLVASTNTANFHVPLAPSGAPQPLIREAARAPFSLEDPELRLVDLDANGVPDALRTGEDFELYFQDGEAGWARTEVRERRQSQSFPNVHFSDPRVKLADMTGDGLQDIVFVDSGTVAYWPYLGGGRWGDKVTMHGRIDFPGGGSGSPFGFDPRRLMLGDVDGDGATDLVYVEAGRVTLWSNQGGYRWSDPIRIDGTPLISDMDSVRLADMLGTGTAGILWSYDAGTFADGNYKFLDLTGAIKPYLLCGRRNNCGARTTIEYSSSSRFFVEDDAEPATRWRAALPFPVQVVRKVTATDHHSGSALVSEFSYHQGYWDPDEREFRGFGLVEQRDTETFARYVAGTFSEHSELHRVEADAFAPPTLTRTWFHQGEIRERSGRRSETEVHAGWAGDAEIFPRSLREGLPAIHSGAAAEGNPKRSRDALRALRGTVLRSEIFALDGSPEQDRPLSVIEELWDVREIAGGEGARIYFPHQLASRTTRWDRGTEPMTAFRFATSYNDYGLPVSELAVAVPRRRDPLAGGAGELRFLALLNVADYALRDDPDHYLADRVATTRQFELVADTELPLFEFLERARDPSAERRLLGQTRNHYDGEAFVGLPVGEIGDYGVVSCIEALAFTSRFLEETFDPADPKSLWEEPPAYLAAASFPAGGEFPPEFVAGLKSFGGYVLGDADASGDVPYFVARNRLAYDFQIGLPPGLPFRGLVQELRDAAEGRVRVSYDEFDLLPTSVEDAVGLKTEAEYDLRTLQARKITDPNGNSFEFTFTPLGLVSDQRVLGKAGEGDLAEASLSFEYDFTAFADREQPVSVRTIRRLYHDSANEPAEELARTISTVEYSDGFGRLLQTRSQGEGAFSEDETFGGSGLSLDPALPHQPAHVLLSSSGGTDRVIVSGWQVYDNKGCVIERYEPFFSTGWEYAAPLDKERGRKRIYHYSGTGQLVRTVNPDGSEERIVVGVPASLSEPEIFRPTPWEIYTYDANDNAGRTHASTASSYAEHWNTPGSIEVDALGRTIRSVVRNGSDPAQWFETRSTYDIQGNLISVADPLGRQSFRYVHDRLGRVWRTETLNSGRRDIVMGPLGNPIEERDAKGSKALHLHDLQGRPVRLWTARGSASPFKLSQRLDYGDGGTNEQSTAERAAAAANNLLGRLVRTYDEAGLSIVERADFKGNVLSHSRRIVADNLIVATIESGASSNWQIEPFAIDWTPPAGQTLGDLEQALLDSAAYETSSRYDALNHVIELTTPTAVDGARRTFSIRYNDAGRLDQLLLDGTPFVERIVHDAKGHRTLVAYGNGIMTRYAYDPDSFRLARLVSEPFVRNGDLYKPSGPPIQDLTYGYDLAGNLRSLEDRTSESGVPNNPDAAGAPAELSALLASGNALISRFSYDPVYRLASASGRECDRPPTGPIWEDAPRCADVTLARLSKEQYRYDELGNLVELRHQSAQEEFVRTFELDASSDRLALVTAAGEETHYVSDSNGNVLSEGESRHFIWDAFDRLSSFRVQAGSAEPSVYAQYLYDIAGQRMKKLVRKQGGEVEITHYINGFEHRRWTSQGGGANNTLHVMDDSVRVALVRVGPEQSGPGLPAVQYQLGDHLGSSSIVLGDDGVVLNREEFTPYGETSFGSYQRKRFRFTGMERDEESGVTYHGSRYYSAPLARWLSVDPAQANFPFLSPYSYVRCNPLSFSDRSGRGPDPPDWDELEEHYQGRASSFRQEVDNLDRKVGEALEKFGEAQQKLQEAEAFKRIGRTKWRAQKEVSKLNAELAELKDEIFKLLSHGQSLEEEVFKTFPRNNTYRGMQGPAAAGKAIRKNLIEGMQVLESRVFTEPSAELVLRAESVGWRNITLLGGVMLKGVGWALIAFGLAEDISYIAHSDDKLRATFNVGVRYAVGYGEFYAFSKIAASRIVGGVATMLLGMCSDQAGSCEEQERYKAINEFIFKEYPGVVSRSRYEFAWSSWIRTEWVYEVEDSETYNEIYDAIQQGLREK